jgi:hypothetical protein
VSFGFVLVRVRVREWQWQRNNNPLLIIREPKKLRTKTAAARVRRTAINVVDVSDNVSEHTYPDKKSDVAESQSHRQKSLVGTFWSGQY